MEHVEHFYKTGQLLKGTYYFDPPLIVPEIEELHYLFRDIQGNKVILNPLRDDVRYTGNYNMNQTLLWLDVSNNTITGWQNVDTDEDEDGEYTLNNLRSIQRWCANNDCNMPYRDGRLFLTELPNTEDIFNQLNESEDFDWVPELTDPSTLEDMELVNFLNQYFENAGYDYRSMLEYDYYIIYDQTGNYVTILHQDEFTLDTIEEDILSAIDRMEQYYHDSTETIREYQELYQALTPLFEMT